MSKPEITLVASSILHATRETPATVVARNESISQFISVTRIWDIPPGEIVKGGSGTGCESWALSLGFEPDGTFSIKLHGDTMLAQPDQQSELPVKLLITGSLKTCEVEVNDVP